jgi:DNA-binding MarR family transcriptional regulator
MTTDLERLGLAVKQAQYRNHRRMDAALHGVGVSLVQWDALRAIDRMPGASGHQLAAATFQSDQSFGTLAGRLEERGLIARSPGRGRRLQYELTERGHEALEDGHRVASGVLEELFSPLDESRRTALLHTLETLTAAPPSAAD